MKGWQPSKRDPADAARVRVCQPTRMIAKSPPLTNALYRKAAEF
jgi:hypothetical protein